MQKPLFALVGIVAIAVSLSVGRAYDRKQSPMGLDVAVSFALVDDLQLTSAQEQRLASVVQTELAELKRISEDESLSSAEKATKSKEVIQAAKIEGAQVLTVGQQKTLARLKAKHLEEIQTQITRRPSDAFVLQIITEDDDRVFPWLAHGNVARRR